MNGQHLDTEFGTLVTLASAGPNAGLAIFDSTPGGPNDPSQDPDLLVGSGNVLILQTENFPPDANDVFPRPNDDEDGGTVGFLFHVPAELQSVRLIDVDASDGTTTLVLTDGAARERTYTVPADWTGDRTLAQPGEGTLFLTTLGAQSGFGSSATAAEDAGFDASAVVRLDVHWSGSGALDDLVLCSAALPRAAAVARNGSGVNPAVLRAVSLPVLGRTWEAELDCSRFGSETAALEARPLAVPGTATPFGELLIAGTPLHRTVRPCSAGASRIPWELPFDLALCGLSIHVQGLCRGSGPSVLVPKALHVGARLSNALDLVLGF